MESDDVNRLQIGRLLAWLVVWASMIAAAWAQFKQPDTEGAQLGEAQVQRWRAGMIVSAASGPCQGIQATAPVPIDWPEQTVTVVDQEITPGVKMRYRMVEGTVKQMVVSIPYLPAGQEARVLVTFEVRRSAQLAPENTDVYQVPDKRRMKSNVRRYLGPSPAIESTSPKIKKLAKQVGADQEKGWDKAEAIYDWVRENVQFDAEFVDRPIRGALAALSSGKGDCEDLSALFIAICRAAGIPARTVWVPGHCYPEFYLIDEQGEGHWFPCQAAGTRAFGEMPDHRPILQKGDNFRAPYNPRERKRYLAEHLTGAGGRPKVKFVRELVSD